MKKIISFECAPWILMSVGIVLLALIPHPAYAANCSISVSPTSINQGQSATISWSVTPNGSYSCFAGQINGYAADFSAVPVDGGGVLGAYSGSFSRNPAVSNTYTLSGTYGTISGSTCFTTSGPAISCSANIAVSGSNAPVMSFYVSPGSVAPGGTVSVNWSGVNMNACNVYRLGSPNVLLSGGPVSGSLSQTISQTTSWWITCAPTDGSPNMTNTITASVTAPAATCSISASATNIVQGQSTTLTWSSTNSTGGSISPTVGSVGTSGTRVVTPSVTTTYTGTFTGAGGNGSCTRTITVTAPPAPTCSLNASPTTINQPNSSYLSWTSANATTFFISTLSYQTPNVSNGASVYPPTTTTYTGTATGPGGTANCSRTVTVNSSCLFNGNTVLHGGSVTAYQASSVPSGNPCISQTRTCNSGTLSGTYAYASCSVTPAANCTFNGNIVLHGASVTAYQASSVPFGNSCVSQSRTCTNGALSGTYANASCSVTPGANCTLDGVTVLHSASRSFYTQQTAPLGQTCSAISQSRTCTDGTLSGSASYQNASCLCASIYSCSGNNIQFTDSSCSTSTVATCMAPSYCTGGQSACQYDDMTFSSFSATSTTGLTFTASGHLLARPALVGIGSRSRLYWNVSNAQSCMVMGSNGDSWTQTSTPSWGVLTSSISSLTRYTLMCAAFPSVMPASLEETVTVLPSPAYEEL